jgi:ABC-type transport system substrate-binding protein
VDFRNKIFLFISTILIASIYWIFLKDYKMDHSKQNLIKMAIDGHWQVLNPALQHTFYGDIVLANQFESLVQIDDYGTITPSSSQSWEVNQDFTVFTFKINREKKFSDGSALNADDFKRSWLNSLELTHFAANNSLLDVLYKIVGFEDYEKTKDISGLQVLDENTLRIRFKSPFRMALEHLKGLRFSVYKKTIDGAIIGTGPYVIKELNKDKLYFQLNSYYKTDEKLSEIELSSIQSDAILTSLKNGEIDCIPFIIGTVLEKDFELNNYQIVTGQEFAHQVIEINHLNDRLFENRNYRLALLYLVHKKLRESTKSPFTSPFFRIDPQLFLPTQSGYLDEKDTIEIIEKGRPYAADLINETKKRPIKVVSASNTSKSIEFLKELGLTLSGESGLIDYKALMEIIYKTSNTDLSISGFSVASGDPDGVYHKLGKNGAILSPMIYSESVNNLLEKGREIVDISILDSHYKKVTREVLNEVPFVHLGIVKSAAVFKSNRISFNKSQLRRSVGSFISFELK